MILDLRANGNNSLVRLLERVVLPRSIDHARDLSQLSEGEWAVVSMILDHADAFHEIPLHPLKIPFCCADLGDHGFLVFFGMGFGGRSFPNVFGRASSFIARHTQAMLDPLTTRLQQFVDDPILAQLGTHSP